MSYTKQNFKDGQVLKAEHLNNIEDGLSKAVVAYEETNMVEVLAECNLQILDDQNAFPLTDEIAFVGGAICIVNWNGVEYSCVAHDLSENGVTTFLIGNGHEFGLDGNGEPFVILYSPTQFDASGWTGVINPLDGTTELTLSIYQDNTVIHPIETKYLPEPLQIGDEDVYLIPETTLTFAPQPDFYGMLGAILTVDAYPDMWNYTIINYNGVDYKCTATGFGSGDRCFLGNTSLASAIIPNAVDTGEPFLVYYIADTTWAVLPKDGSVPATFSVRVQKAIPMNYRYVGIPIIDLDATGLLMPSVGASNSAEVGEDFIRNYRRAAEFGLAKFLLGSREFVATFSPNSSFAASAVDSSGFSFTAVQLSTQDKIVTISWYRVAFT